MRALNPYSACSSQLSLFLMSRRRGLSSWSVPSLRTRSNSANQAMSGARKVDTNAKSSLKRALQ